MIKIIKQLINFGMDFQYENYGSEGEKITAYQLGLVISNQQGKIYYSCSAPTETFNENDAQYQVLSQCVKEECINNTQSF